MPLERFVSILLPGNMLGRRKMKRFPSNTQLASRLFTMALIGLCSTSSHAQSTCEKFRAAINCAAVVGHRCNEGSFPDDRLVPDEQKFNKALWHNTAQKACQSTARYSGNGVVISYNETEPGSGKYECKYQNKLGRPIATILSKELVPDRDPCCSYSVRGPYSHLLMTQAEREAEAHEQTLPPLVNGKPGSEFSYTKRNKIKNVSRNKGHPIGKTKSDAFAAGYDLHYGLTDRVAGQQLMTDAQVHHIIPRLDSRGCPCGAGSFNNALVISAQLNNEIGNDRTNWKLLQIIEMYRVPN